MGVSENRGPQYGTLNSRILIIRTTKEVSLIFRNSRILKEPVTDTPWRLSAYRKPHTPKTLNPKP